MPFLGAEGVALAGSGEESFSFGASFEGAGEEGGGCELRGELSVLSVRAGSSTAVDSGSTGGLAF